MRTGPTRGPAAKNQLDDLGWSGQPSNKPTDSTASRSNPRNQLRPFLEARSSKRQRLVAHLHAAGPRPTLEALIAVESGQPLDEVLADFGRVAVSTYHSVGASELPISKPLVVLRGGHTDE
jgi:hypothetical protein